MMSACVKDRIFIPNNNNTSGKPNPTDTVIKLYLNEFLASNNTISVPGYTYFPDWIEIYNAGSQDVNLAGYYITDDLTNREKYRIPSGSASTIIKAKAYLIILADDSVALGPLHANFSLSKSGESIGLYNPSKVGIDSITYTIQTTDKTFGRLPNGNGNWQECTVPSPNVANN